MDPTNLKPEIQTMKKKMPDNSLLVSSQRYFCLPAVSSGESVTIKVIISRKKDDVFICTAHSSPPFISCTHQSMGALTLPLQRRAHSQGKGGDRQKEVTRKNTASKPGLSPTLALLPQPLHSKAIFLLKTRAKTNK